MVRTLLFCLLTATAVIAGSGDYAWNALQLYKNGRYADSWRAWNTALAEAQKEGDLEAEGRVRVSLAVLATRAGHFEDAKNLLNSVDLLAKKKAFSGRALEALACAKMELALTQKNYREASAVELPKEKKKSADLLGLAAVANAGIGNASAALNLLAEIDGDDHPGQLAFYTAWAADLGRTLPAKDIVELYQKALDRAISAKQYYTVAQILKRLGETERANTIFSSLGLQKF
jgi:hypothetical protein